MKILLRLKSWQLFLITWCMPICTYFILLRIDPLLGIYLGIIFIPVVMILFLTGTLGWIWAISIHLNHKLPENVKLKISIFKFLSFFVILFFILIILKLILTPLGYFDFYLTAKTFGIIFFVISGIIIWSTRFAAKTVKSIEIGRMAKFSEYVIEFFLINFSFIGYLILQPRINRIMKNKY